MKLGRMPSWGCVSALMRESQAPQAPQPERSKFRIRSPTKFKRPPRKDACIPSTVISVYINTTYLTYSLQLNRSDVRPRSTSGEVLFRLHGRMHVDVLLQRLGLLPISEAPALLLPRLLSACPGLGCRWHRRRNIFSVDFARQVAESPSRNTRHVALFSLVSFFRH